MPQYRLTFETPADARNGARDIEATSDYQLDFPPDDSEIVVIYSISEEDSTKFQGLLGAVSLEVWDGLTGDWIDITDPLDEWRPDYNDYYPAR